MKKKDGESFLEDLLAATSPEYLTSIREARADYKAGRTMSHKEVSGEWNTILYRYTKRAVRDIQKLDSTIKKRVVKLYWNIKKIYLILQRL